MNIVWLGALAVGGYFLYEWLQTQCANATTAAGGIFPDICPYMPGYVAPATTPVSSTVSPAVPVSPVSGQITFTLTDTTLAGQFLAGDSYQLAIAGPPNTEVFLTSNGNTLSAGMTNSSGVLVITGVVPAAAISQTISAGAWTAATVTIGPAGIAGLGFYGIDSNMINGGAW
jgi:hypothetical protein